uniref:PDCD11_0 protein n=1 Tax=Fopius arisanus TaxID=64838 RepID=A0A0C9RER1_9HYME
MVQQNFPRGGKKPLKKNLPNYALLQASKLKSQKSKMKKRKGEDAQLKTGIIARAALNLTYGTLTQGMILLGRVQRSSQYDVTISLPGRLSGLLQITDISEAYTNLLQNLVSSQLPPPDFKPLSDLYKRGNYLVCYVKVIDVQSKHRVILSVQPEMINLNFDSGKLAPGSRIACSISCVEDHGYVVDTGNKNLRGFLSKNDVKVGVKYYVGQQVFCVVRSTTTTEGITTLKLTTDPKFTNSPLSSEDQHLNSLIPGTKLSVVIKKLLPDGLHISFNKDNIGYINRLYLENPLDTYEEGSQLFATFLYTLPTVKFSYFTEIALEPECATLTIGEMEKAKILFHDRKGIALRIKKNFRGYMPLKRTGVEFDQIRDKFPPNSVHKCRILTYDNFDRVYICSALKHELTLEYKIPETVTAGDLMPVQIIRESPNKFLFVKSGRILGDVPPEQIRDIDDAVVPLIGKKVLARVLSRDKNGERFNFTLKRSLVESNRPILSEFTQAQVGSTYLGTVINKSGKGLLIKFYEDLKGVIPSKALRNIPGGIKAFREGQVIEVKVANVIIQERRLILELATADKKRMICPFEIGETVEGKVIDSSVEGVHIRILNPSGNDAITAYLPAGHMSPCEKTGKQMAALSVPGDTMSALVFSTTPEFILTTTLNPQKWYTDIKNLSVSDCIPCSITQINTTGIEVLLPVKDLKCYGIVSLNKIDNIKLLFKHQILFGKITQINKKTQVIHLTTIFHEVWSSAVENDTDLIASVDVLALYLSKLKQLASFSYYSTHKISKMKLGQKVSGVVETITENGTVIKLNDGVPAIARKSHAEKSLKIGDKVNGSILWINYVDELVEITLDPILMNAIKPKQNEIPEDALKKKLKGEIVLINRWFVLVVLKGCGKGNLVALPTKAHVNDLTPDLSSYKIGAKIKCYVIMKDNESEIIPIVYRNAGFVTPKLHKSGMVDCQVKMDDNITPGDEFVVSETIQKKRKRHLENVTEKNRAMKKLKTDPITNSSSHKTKSIKTKREIALIKSKNEEQQEMFTCANESEGLVTFALAEDAEDANKKN